MNLPTIPDGDAIVVNSLCLAHRKIVCQQSICIVILHEFV